MPLSDRTVDANQDGFSKPRVEVARTLQHRADDLLLIRSVHVHDDHIAHWSRLERHVLAIDTELLPRFLIRGIARTLYFVHGLAPDVRLASQNWSDETEFGHNEPPRTKEPIIRA